MAGNRLTNLCLEIVVEAIFALCARLEREVAADRYMRVVEYLDP